MKEKILIVTEYFYPGTRPDSYLLTEIAKKLFIINKGNVEVVCTTDLENHEELECFKGKIVRLRKSSLNEINLYSRILRFLITTVSLGKKTFFLLKKNDHLFGVTNPAFMVLVYAFIRKFKKVKYTLLVYDVFPENLISANILKKNSISYILSKRLFDWAYKQADELVVIGRDMEELILEKVNSTVPTTLITNWCDVNEVIPSEKNKNEIVKKFKLEDSVVFAFTGNLGRVQGIDNLLEMADLVKHPKFKMLFIGKGAMLPKIETYINANPEGKVIYAGSYAREEQNIFLNACDVAVVSLTHSMYGLGVPSKSYYNMAAHKPLFYIGNERSEIGRVVKENNIGWVLEDSNPIELAKKVDEILYSDVNINGLGDRARDVVEEKYSKEVVLEKYEQLFSA